MEDALARLKECRRHPGRGRHRRCRPARQRGRISDRALRDRRRPERLPRRPRLAAALCRARRAVRQPRRRAACCRACTATARFPRRPIGMRSTCCGRSCRRPTATTSAERRRGDRLSDHAVARRADRRRRDGALNGERVPTFPPSSATTSPGSVAGIPGISLPAAMTASGLPLGIEFDAPEGATHACWRSRWRSSACCRSCPLPRSNEEVTRMNP